MVSLDSQFGTRRDGNTARWITGGVAIEEDRGCHWGCIAFGLVWICLDLSFAFVLVLHVSGAVFPFQDQVRTLLLGMGMDC